MRKFFFIFIFTQSLKLPAQHHYVPPTDTLVIKKLSQWQDWKFGLLMHWGTYSQWGIVESWSICPEDEGWTQRDSAHGKTYNEYKSNYEKLQTTFNPAQFDPVKWAAAAAAAGMKYVVFTTKHHDGFCMFDTKRTDYKVSSLQTPFHSNSKANVAKEIFNAFRKEGLAAGAYFSKPDWHNENYWWPYFPPKDRSVNYDPEKYPQRWNAFKDFTYAQLKELMSEYGKMDILWLDGGWIRPANTIDSAVEWERNISYVQDVDMPKIAAMARSYQPGLLIVDRSVGNEYENYTTPEQQVPDKPLGYPWESCITMATSWSHVPGDRYKSSEALIHLLIKVVARGGNLLLNIGPDAKGQWDDTAYARLKDIGAWMKINAESIYATRALFEENNKERFMTMANDSNSAYVFLLGDMENTGSIIINNPVLQKFNKAVLLGSTAKLALKKENNRVILSLPGGNPLSKLKYAAVIKCTK